MSKNLLVIISDQLSFRGLNIYGNDRVKTPNLDSFFKDGFIFDNAYTTCPLCQPARSALWSGWHPHNTGAMSNGRWMDVPQLSKDVTTLGERLGEAGYNCIHLGKTHDAGSLRGFDCTPQEEPQDLQSDVYVYNYDTWRDIDNTRRTVDTLNTIGDDKFALIVDFNNPHNICNFCAFADTLAEDAIPDLPPLPPNFDVPDMETRPLPVQYLCCSHNRQRQATQWNDLQFRQYIAAYYHYVELLDSQLGEVFAALEASGKKDDTIVCFCADHGDNMAARRMTTKHSSFYEETTHVPLFFAGKDIPGGRSEALVSHLDLVPTFCSMLGVEIQEDLWGDDLCPVMAGEKDDVHDFVVSEWHSEWGTTVEPCRMLRSKDFKYTRYRENEAEELYDLRNDPYEIKNLVNDAAYAEQLNQHRALLDKHMQDTDDGFPQMDIDIDPRWRSHAPGFRNHEGPTAPELRQEQEA